MTHLYYDQLCRFVCFIFNIFISERKTSNEYACKSHVLNFHMGALSSIYLRQNLLYSIFVRRPKVRDSAHCSFRSLQICITESKTDTIKNIPMYLTWQLKTIITTVRRYSEKVCSWIIFDHIIQVNWIRFVSVELLQFLQLLG